MGELHTDVTENHSQEQNWYIYINIWQYIYTISTHYQWFINAIWSNIQY